MILSERGGFIFVHNPKAGGMSTRVALAGWDDSGGLFDGWSPYPAAGRRLDRMHLTLEQLRRHHPETFARFEDLWSFGFVRDPYQRLCSAFSQHLTLGTPSLRDTIRAAPDLFYPVLSRFMLRVLDPRIVEGDVRLTHFQPQHRFFELDRRRVTQEAAPLLDPPGWSPRIRALLGEAGPARQNANPHAVAGYDVSRITPEALDRANRFYERDFALFGFAQRSGAQV